MQTLVDACSIAAESRVKRSASRHNASRSCVAGVTARAKPYGLRVRSDGNWIFPARGRVVPTRQHDVCPGCALFVHGRGLFRHPRALNACRVTLVFTGNASDAWHDARLARATVSWQRAPPFFAFDAALFDYQIAANVQGVAFFRYGRAPKRSRRAFKRSRRAFNRRLPASKSC